MQVEATDLSHGVRLLTMNRPPANAIGTELNAALCERCREARQDASVRAVIVTGAGRFFSGGLDLKEAASAVSSLVNLAGSEEDGVHALWTMPKPTVAMVNGHAIAGGLVIALACDFRVTQAGNQRLGLNEVAMGLPFPTSAFEIVRLALAGRALRYALFEGSLSGPERALELGWVDEVVEPAKLEARCVELARKLGQGSQPAYAHMKRAMQREAISRILAETPEQRRAIAEIATSQESRALLMAQLGRLSGR